MSINVSPNNVYFLPNTNQHGLSLNASVLTKNIRSFEFKVRFLPDWSTVNKDYEYGVIMLNGSHLGITIHPNHVCGTIWTTNGVEQLFAKIDRNSLSEDDAIECSFKVDNENKTISLGGEDGIFWYHESQTKKFEGDLVDDYETSYLWIGCSNAISSCPEEHRWYFTGRVDYLEIIKEEETIFKSNMEKLTEFKIYDESETGNHFLKWNTEWMDD